MLQPRCTTHLRRKHRKFAAKGRTLSRTERTGSATGAITYKATTAYHPTFNLPTLTTEPNKRVAISYDAKGNVLGYVDYTTSDATGVLGLSAPIVSSQSTGWVFNAQQLPTSARYTETKSGITSPASTFSFTYNALGNLTQFTQSIAGGALETGKLTSYNANGAFLTGTSTTNQAVKHSYTPRGQLASTTVANQVTTYTYDAIGQSKQVAYPNGDKLVYTYDAAHKLQSIKWNGTEQYTPTAGISSNLAALATLGGYSGISNPELAYKLGVNASTLDVLDGVPKALTAASNAAAFAAVELAKDVALGKRAQAQFVLPPPRVIPPITLGGISEGWGMSTSMSLPSGFRIGKDGTVRSETGAKICTPNNNPEDCDKLKRKVDEAKDAARGQSCKGIGPDLRKERMFRDLWQLRIQYQALCWNGKGHEQSIEDAKNAMEWCR